MRRRSVWWLIALAATALAVAVPAALWQSWGDAATPTESTSHVAGKRAKKTAAGLKKGTTGAERAAGRSAAKASSGPAGVVSFDRNGRPQAWFVPLRLTDPAGAGAPSGERFVETTIAVQNLTDAPLRLPAAMIQVRDAAGGLHAPESTAAAVGTPPATERPARAAKAAKPTKPAKSANSRRAATPRARAANRAANDTHQAASGGATPGDIVIDPGQTQTVTLRFAVPASARVASILLAPDGNHFVSLAVLPQSPVAVGTPTAANGRRDHAANAGKPRATPRR
ncbi:MAG TPA: hypothetical protein VFI22_17580 [Thermomicrobiales bacterium]|nr:hypothetical protein [Thermomicrobiales bacterium]